MTRSVFFANFYLWFRLMNENQRLQQNRITEFNGISLLFENLEAVAVGNRTVIVPFAGAVMVTLSPG